MCRMQLTTIQLSNLYVLYDFHPTVTVELLQLIDNSNTARLSNSKFV